jgi:hypothetical protein
MMKEREVTVASFSELRQFVHHTFCEFENLLEDQFETHSRPLLSKGTVCGVEFSLQGLRSVRLAAIWAADLNVLYFYNARGERCLVVRLNGRIALPEAAAA